MHEQIGCVPLSTRGHLYRMVARHGAPFAKPTTHVTLSMRISVFDLTKSSLACAARRNVAASASVVTHRRPRFSQRAPGQTSRRRLTSSGFHAKRTVAISDHTLEAQHRIVPHRQTPAQLNAAIGSGSSGCFTQSLFRYPSHQGVMIPDPWVGGWCPEGTVTSFAGGMSGGVPRPAKMYVKKASTHRLRSAIATGVLRLVRNGTEPNPFGGGCSPQ